MFRQILAEAEPEDRVRMYLFRELWRFFDVRVQTLILIIADWSYWTEGQYDDETLNAMLEGKLLLRDSECFEASGHLL